MLKIEKPLNHWGFSQKEWIDVYLRSSGFPPFKKTRGSNFKNREVQCLLQNQEGQFFLKET
mgnify:CR=1 FL=1